MIYYAAAGAAATTTEMYLRENAFEKNGVNNDAFFLFEIMHFPNRPKTIMKQSRRVCGQFSMETIDFDFENHNKIMSLVNELGSDGRLLLNKEKEVYHVTLCEKLLVLSLIHISEPTRPY